MEMWVDAIQAVFTCSRWRKRKKEEKCKSLIKRVQTHLTIQKNRREAIVRQSRADIGQLLRDRLPEKALERVVQLYKDQCMVCAYGLMQQFCKCAMSNVSLIMKETCCRMLPFEIVKAMSGLIFAAERCGELPQLRPLRNLFQKRYGHACDLDEMEATLGKGLNFHIKQYLCIGSVPDNVKQKLMNEIAKDYGLSPIFLDPDVEQKAEVLDLDIQDSSSEDW